MTIDKAVSEWQSKSRKMGCVSAARWFCKRVPGFALYRVTRYTKNGESYGHVVASNGKVVIDLASYADIPNEYDSTRDGQLQWRLTTT